MFNIRRKMINKISIFVQLLVKYYASTFKLILFITFLPILFIKYLKFDKRGLVLVKSLSAPQGRMLIKSLWQCTYKACKCAEQYSFSHTVRSCMTHLLFSLYITWRNMQFYSHFKTAGARV